MEFRLQLAQSVAGLGSCGNAVLVVHLRVWLLQRDGVLFRVPPSAVVILARVHFPPDGLPCVTHQEAPFCRDLAARRGLGRLGRFIGAGTLLDHPSEYVRDRCPPGRVRQLFQHFDVVFSPINFPPILGVTRPPVVG